MATFEITEIREMSGLSIGQIEQAISRERLPVQGEGRRGHARQFSVADAFNFCVIGEMRRLGIEWKRIVGSTAFPWPIAGADVFEIRKTDFFLLTPMLRRHVVSKDAAKKLDITPVKPKQITGDLRASKAGAGILIDASEIAKRIEIFVRRRQKMTRDIPARTQQRRPEVDTYSAQETVTMRGQR
jgi:hypothetical protein